jgi:hypothetical protein
MEQRRGHVRPRRPIDLQDYVNLMMIAITNA